MRDVIKLKVIGYVSGDGQVRLVCLDTNIAVSANSLNNAMHGMKDALYSYFKTFSKEELENGEYLRKAEFKYFVLFYFYHLAHKISKVYHALAEYNPQTNHLQFA